MDTAVQPLPPAAPPATLDDVRELLAQLVDLARASRTTQAGTAAPARELLTTDQAATFCGMSRRLFQKQVSSGRVPRGIKFGKCRRWVRSELVDWVCGGCRPVSEWTVRQTARAQREKFQELRAG